MPGATLTYVVSEIERLMQRIGEPTPLQRAIGITLVASTKRRFTESRAPDGSTWRPLSPYTIRRRRRGRGRRRSAKPLLDTGRLRNSITYRVAGEVLYVGTNVEYAGIHQFGARGAGRHHRVVIPARPFLGISRDDREKIEHIIQDFIRGELL